MAGRALPTGRSWGMTGSIDGYDVHKIDRSGQVRRYNNEFNTCCRFSPARPLPPRETRHTSARGRREPLPPSPPARIAGSPAQSRKDHLAPLSAERSPCRSPPAAAGAPAARESLPHNIIRYEPAFLMSLFTMKNDHSNLPRQARNKQKQSFVC